MRKGIGISFIVLGILCILFAVGLVVYNRMEARNGQIASQVLLESVQDNIRQATQPEPSQPGSATDAPQPDRTSEPAIQEMQTVSAGNYDSIGILSIPVLEVELPVLTDWNYDKLRNAPCLYYGSCYEPNFVIAAHNYASHFGRLSQLQPGDFVLFTDVTGTVYCYEVVMLETLPPTATEEMITSGFDLSLYTCTPGGNNRVTVRCSTVTP